MPQLLNIEDLEHEIALSGMAISAAEDWAPLYSKAPEAHAKLIVAESRLERAMRKYLRELAEDRLFRYINWSRYQTELIKAFDVEVVVEDMALEPEVEILFQALIDPMADAISSGAQAGEKIYKIPIGASPASDAVQQAAREHIANLVKVNGDHSLVVTTRSKIRQAIATALEAGENQQQATERVMKIINNPVRAGIIARTEAVNAYGQGTLVYGRETNATKKYWVSSSGPCGLCKKNISAGQIAFADAFPTGHMAPACHTSDRCGLGLVHDYNEAIPIIY